MLLLLESTIRALLSAYLLCGRITAIVGLLTTAGFGSYGKLVLVVVLEWNSSSGLGHGFRQHAINLFLASLSGSCLLRGAALFLALFDFVFQVGNFLGAVKTTIRNDYLSMLSRFMDNRSKGQKVVSDL